MTTHKFLFVYVFGIQLFLSNRCLAQTPENEMNLLKAKILQYESLIGVYQDSIRMANEAIKNHRLRVLENEGSFLRAVIRYRTYVAEDARAGYKTIGYLEPGDSVILHAVKDYKFLASGKGMTGYIGGTSVGKSPEIDAFYEMQLKKEQEEIRRQRAEQLRIDKREKRIKDSIENARQEKYYAQELAEKQKQLAELKKLRADRIRKLFGKHGTETVNRIINGDIWIGMTKLMAEHSVGPAKKINRTVTSTQVHEQWVYDEMYLYFENGILTSFQD